MLSSKDGIAFFLSVPLHLNREHQMSDIAAQVQLHVGGFKITRFIPGVTILASNMQQSKFVIIIKLLVHQTAPDEILLMELFEDSYRDSLLF